MAFAPLQSASVAIGEVSADAQKKVVQHLKGGIISEIFVKEGTLVKKDQLLIKLDTLQENSQLDAYTREYMDSSATFSRLTAQRDSLSTIKFLDEVTDLNIIKDQKNIFLTTTRSLKDQKEIFTGHINKRIKIRLHNFSTYLYFVKHFIYIFLELKVFPIKPNRTC